MKIIRKLERTDLDALTSVLMRSYPDEGWTQECARAYLGKISSFDPDCCYVAVESDGALSAGVLAYSYCRANRQILYLQELFVDRAFRHRGIATALVEEVRSSVVDDAHVAVDPLVKDDTAVLNFYHSLGLEPGPEFALLDKDF